MTVPDPAPGEVQVKNIWMTVDPYMRGRMVDRASYVPPFQLGEPLQGGAIGEVAASNDSRLKPGDLVSTMFGWRESFNAPAANLQKLDTFGLPPQAFLGVAGMPGLTAWVGLLKVAALKPETWCLSQPRPVPSAGRLSDRQDQGAHGHRISGRRRQRCVSQADRGGPRHRL